MTVLDASAVLALLKDEEGAASVASLLAQGGAQLTHTGLVEVIDKSVRVYSRDLDALVADLAQLGLINPPALTSMCSIAAARLRIRHYHRLHRAVSLADCVAAATAQQLQRPLATSDPALLDLCAEEGIPYVALPGSDGTRHEPQG